MKRIVVGIIVKNKKILLIKHKRKKMWLPAGGHVNKQESDNQALKREIKEEINLNVKVEKKPFYIILDGNEAVYHYLCKIISGKIKIDIEEVLDFRWFSKKQIKNSKLDKRVKEFSLIALNENKKSVNILCICSKGLNRSNYLANYLHKKGYSTRFGGVEKYSGKHKEYVNKIPNPISQEDINWADIIIIIRKRLKKVIKSKFDINGKKIIILDVTDSGRLIPEKYSHLRKLNYERFQDKWTRPQLRKAIKPFLPLKL